MKTTPADFMSSMMNSVQDRRGVSGAFMGDRFKDFQWGVKIPHLMMEYLFCLNVIPMPTIIELAGMQGSCKSTFLQYLMRIFAEQGMNAHMIETEGKMSWTLFESILREHVSRTGLTPGPMSQEEWMAEFLFACANYRKAYSASLDAYRRSGGQEPLVKPFLEGLDSLGGAPSNETMKTTDKDKSVGRSFPIEALKNSRFFPQIPVRMRDLPMVFVYTNHEQTRITEQKGPFAVQGPRSSQGGHRPDFFCGLRIFFEQQTKPKTVSGVTTQVLKLETVKNSFGEKNRSFALPMCWKTVTDEETGEDRQETWFDWEGTLTNFLAPPSGVDTKFPRTELKKLITVVRNSEASFSCKELGLDKVSPQEVGRAIESEPDLVKEIRPILGISTWRVWDGKPLIDSVKAELDLPAPDLNVTEADVKEE